MIIGYFQLWLLYGFAVAICALVLWVLFRRFLSRPTSLIILLLLSAPLFVPFSVDAEKENTIKLYDQPSAAITADVEILDDTGLSASGLDQSGAGLTIESEAGQLDSGYREMRMAPAWVVAAFEYFQSNTQEAYAALKSILLVQCVLLALLLIVALLKYRFFPLSEHRLSSNR